MRLRDCFSQWASLEYFAPAQTSRPATLMAFGTCAGCADSTKARKCVSIYQIRGSELSEAPAHAKPRSFLAISCAAIVSTGIVPSPVACRHPKRWKSVKINDAYICDYNVQKQVDCCIIRGHEHTSCPHSTLPSAMHACGLHGLHTIP